MALAAIAFLGMAACGRGAVVNVTPENMQGWVVALNQGAQAGLINHGPAGYERERPFVAADDRDLGQGAFYAAIGFEGGDTPPTAWLGLDTCNGQALAGTALKRITALEYYAYNAHIPVATSNPNNWTSWKLWWTYPRQLIQLQITAQSPDGKQRKQFWFMPWQKQKVRGENSGRHCKKWLRYDAINFNGPGPAMCGRWFTFGPPRQEFDSWASLIRDYGDWTLAPTSTASFGNGGWKSAGWDNATDPPGDPTCTATGMGLNFVTGARKAFAPVFEAETIRWANDYRGFKGYLDGFTLGIDGRNVTFNFEPAANSPQPKIIRLSNPDAAKVKPDGIDLVKITGKVVERNGAMFALDDGSGTIIRGFLYTDIQTGQNPAKLGEHWAVWGHLEKVPFQPADEPALIWTCPEHMTKLQP